MKLMSRIYSWNLNRKMKKVRERVEAEYNRKVAEETGVYDKDAYKKMISEPYFNSKEEEEEALRECDERNQK